jgi:replicative DNA helicase
MTMQAPPNTPEAEKSVLGQIMAGGPKVAGNVIGTLLEPGDFYSSAHRALFEKLVEHYYADEPVDAITIAEACVKRLTNLWNCDADTAIVRVRDMAVGQKFAGQVADHAKIIKADSDSRALLQVAASIEAAVEAADQTPQEIGAHASQEAMKIATNTILTSEILSFGDIGRRYIRAAEREMVARQQGVELGAYFGVRFMDDFMRGLRPTELWICGGEPGAGKSAVCWDAARRFAERQFAKNPPERRVGAFVLSLEMGELDSEVRIAQALTKIDGGVLREAKQSRTELTRIINEWGRRKEIPLWFNFASNLRASQLRALIVEAIRRHNVGLVIIDHFRYFDLDRRVRDPIQEDEEKARFLKEEIAKDLNVAVVCLAHTTKGIESSSDRRPTLSHLRGSGLVAAHADFVSFVYRPWMYATEQAKNNGQVFETDAEMIWRKNRHSHDGIAAFHFEPQTMTVTDRALQAAP